MVDLDRLRVSLTKNGSFKLAELLKVHGRWEVLEHVEGAHQGIDIKPSQIKNILDQNPLTNDIPEFWDTIRGHGPQAIDAFVLMATLFSHGRLIRLFQDASHGRAEFTGYFLRSDFPQEKEYTNIAYTLGCFGVSEYRRGAGAVEFDLTPAVYHLRTAHGPIQELLRSKLARAGWIDPARNQLSPDRGLMAELEAHRFNRVVSMDWDRFVAWIAGRLEMPVCPRRFGLREVGLFPTPIPAPRGQ